MVALLLGARTALCQFPAPATPAPTAPAAPYEIRSIQRIVKHRVDVDNSWKDNAPCVEADVRLTTDTEKNHPYVKAYFYNHKKAVIQKFDAPARGSDDYQNYASIPDYFKAKEYYKACFPITARASEAKDKWAHVIIVIGEGKQAVAQIYPNDDISQYDFGEKSFATFKTNGASASPFSSPFPPGLPSRSTGNTQ